MNIRAEPKRNSETEIKRKDTLRDGFGCGVTGAVGGVTKKGKGRIKSYLGFMCSQK